MELQFIECDSVATVKGGYSVVHIISKEIWLITNQIKLLVTWVTNPNPFSVWKLLYISDQLLYLVTSVTKLVERSTSQQVPR